MKLGKRYRQLIDEWVGEITRKYPQVKFEGVGRLPRTALSLFACVVRQMFCLRCFTNLLPEQWTHLSNTVATSPFG
jgi:hypothetical protein